MDKSVEEMRAELREAEQVLEQREKAELKAKLEATPIIYKFTVSKADNRRREIYDTSCLFYEIKAEITNRDEAKAAGHPEHCMRVGGMTYAFNALSGRIVCEVGGGTIWIGSGWGSDEQYDSAQRAMVKVSQFIVDNPDGGDITDIVEAHRNERKSL